MIESPYKFLFPLGILYALSGLSLWILYHLEFLAYPGPLHAQWMIQGFLLSFAVGFLMTALPRFLNAPPCSIAELLLAVGSICLGFLTPFLSSSLSGLLNLAPFIVLALYFLKRFRRRSFEPPPSFIFVPMGITLGVLGFFSPILLKEGVMLSFIFGIGSRLIPALLGHTEPILIQLEKPALWKTKQAEFAALACLFALGILFHLIGEVRWGDFFWALTASLLAVRAWRLHLKPKHPGFLSYLLWLCTWSLIFGLWAMTFEFNQRLAFLHMVYITGMCLMTLLVATRVILAHGGFDMGLERDSKALLLTGIFCLLAAATRVSAVYFSTQAYTSHLAYASLCLIVAILIWFSGIGHKVFRKPPTSKSESD